MSIQVSFFDIRSLIITISSQKTSSSVFHSFIRSKWNRFGRSHRVLRAHWAFSSYSSVTQPTAASQSVWLSPHTELWPRRRSRRWTSKKQGRREWKREKLSAGNKTMQRNTSRTTSSLQTSEQESYPPPPLKVNAFPGCGLRGWKWFVVVRPTRWIEKKKKHPGS